MTLAGQIALVTGASAPRGIGRAIAMRLAAEGAAVMLCDLGTGGQPNLLDQAVDTIAAEDGQAAWCVLDVTDPGSVQAAFETVQSQFGGLDILVNNAATLIGSDAFMATTPAQWEQSFHVNLLGPMRMIQGAIPMMQERGGGRIINIGSTGSLGAEPGFGAYTAMKHGLIGLSNTIAAEFGPEGILCNTVCPGYIATDMHEAANARLAAENGISVPEQRAQRYANVALRAAGQPEDVAEAVAYLAGPSGRYVTGIALPVSGGVPPGI